MLKLYDVLVVGGDTASIDDCYFEEIESCSILLLLLSVKRKSSFLALFHIYSTL